MSTGKLVRLGLGVAGAGLLVLVALASWAVGELRRPYAGWEGEALTVEIEPGLDAGRMLERLARAGVVRRPRLVRAWLGWRGGAERLHAGEYRFDGPIAPVELLERLQRGDVVLYSVTLPEGLVLSEVAQRFEQAGFGPASSLLAEFNDPSLVRDLDPEAGDLEGYLFPDTYHFRRGEQPGKIARTLVQRFRDVLGRDFGERAEQVGLDLREAVILASMIEEETSVAEERQRISQVFHNRLSRGMKLECDPTVRYALHRSGQTVKRLTYAHLRFDSPWNTYVVSGLPSGPICNPGQESLEASVSPIEGNELYFVASPEGGHRFSENLDQHLRAVAEWRRYVRSSR